MADMLYNVASGRMKQFVHLLLCQPNSLVYKPAFYFCEPIFSLINYNLTLALIQSILIFRHLFTLLSDCIFYVQENRANNCRSLVWTLILCLLYHAAILPATASGVTHPHYMADLKF